MDLSTPSPKRGTMKIAQVIGIVILSALCLYVLYFVWQFLTDPDTLARLMRLGLELAALFFLWMVTIGRKRK
jgi:hypothetical protein